MVKYKNKEITEKTIFEFNIKCTRVEKLDGRKSMEHSASDPFIVALVLRDPSELPKFINTEKWTSKSNRPELAAENKRLVNEQRQYPKYGVDFSQGCGEKIDRTDVRWDKEHPKFERPIQFKYDPEVKRHYITFQLYDCDHYNKNWDEKEDKGHVKDKLVDDLKYQTFIAQRTYVLFVLLYAGFDLLNLS